MAERALALYQRCGTSLCGEVFAWDSVRLRTASTHWNVPGKCGLLKKEPMVLSELVEFGPCVSAETVKTRALIGLHMMAEENALRSDRKSLLALVFWRDDGFEEERSEDTSSVEYHEHSVDNLVGQHWTSGVISLFLEDWEVGRVATSCHLSVDLLCQEMRDVCKGSSESLDYPRSLCSECQRSSLVELSQQQSLFLTVERL